MPEAVIVETARTPIGRAFKGSLTDYRPDDLCAFIVDDLMNKVPVVDRASVVDVMVGAANHAGEQGYNVARNVAVLAGLPDTVFSVAPDLLARAADARVVAVAMADPSGR